MNLCPPYFITGFNNNNDYFSGRKLPRPSSARPAPPRVKKQDAAEDLAMRYALIDCLYFIISGFGYLLYNTKHNVH